MQTSKKKQERTALALRARITEQRKLKDQQRALYELSRELSKSAVPEDVAQVAVSRARTVLGAAAAVVYRITEGGDEAQLVAGECKGKPVKATYSLPLDSHLPLSTALRTREPVWIPSYEALVERYPDFVSMVGVSAESIQAVAATPLLAAGRAVGGFVVTFAQPRDFSELEKEFLLVVAEQCANAFARSRILEHERCLRERVEQQAAQLEAEAELRERFMGVLGHDLRTPLAAIFAAAHFLERSNYILPPGFMMFERIVKSASRMQRMIDQMLDFTRIRHCGGLLLYPVMMDLAALVEDICAELRTAHPGAVLLLETRGDCRGHWDSDRLSQVVTNLLQNAIKHGHDAPVRVLLESEMTHVVLAVTNEGAAISSEVTRRIFEPFQKGPGTVRDGLGLGLYISKEIVTAHGGTLTVSCSEAGITFTVALPRLTIVDARRASAPPPRKLADE